MYKITIEEIKDITGEERYPNKQELYSQLLPTLKIYALVAMINKVEGDLKSE